MSLRSILSEHGTFIVFLINAFAYQFSDYPFELALLWVVIAIGVEIISIRRRVVG